LRYPFNHVKKYITKFKSAFYNLISSRDYCATEKFILFTNYAKLMFIGFLLNMGIIINKINVLKYTIYIPPKNFGGPFVAILDIFFNEIYKHDIMYESPIIFDIGANIGLATLYFKFKHPNAKIYAFEPIPETVNILKKNTLVNNLKNVYVNPVAVGKEGELLFSYGGAGDTGASIQNEKDTKNIIKLKSISLSNFIKENNIEHIDLLKIDIEGGEIEVLSDIRDTFDKIDTIIMEWHYPLDKFKEFSKKLQLDRYYNTLVNDSIITLYKKL